MAGMIKKQQALQRMSAQQQSQQQQRNPKAPGQYVPQVPNEKDPNFLRALKYAMRVLYEQKAAGDIAEQLRAAPDKGKALGDISYQILKTVDQRTDGAVPRRLIMLLAMSITKEILDIGEAAKMKLTPQDAAAAFKNLLLQYLKDSGANTEQLQQAMDQVNPAVFSQGK